MDTYDSNQRSAVLLICQGCQQGYYVTTPTGWRLCVWCSKK